MKTVKKNSRQAPIKLGVRLPSSLLPNNNNKNNKKKKHQKLKKKQPSQVISISRSVSVRPERGSTFFRPHGDLVNVVVRHPDEMAPGVGKEQDVVRPGPMSKEKDVVSNRRCCGCGVEGRSGTCVSFIIHNGALFIAFDRRTCLANGEIYSDTQNKMIKIFDGFYMGYTGSTNVFEKIGFETADRFREKKPTSKKELVDFIKSRLDPALDDVDFGLGGIFKGKIELMKIECSPTNIKKGKPPLQVFGLGKSLDSLFLGSGSSSICVKDIIPKKKENDWEALERIRIATERVIRLDWHCGGYLTYLIVRKNGLVTRKVYKPNDIEDCSRGYTLFDKQEKKTWQDNDADCAPDFFHYFISHQ